MLGLQQPVEFGLATAVVLASAVVLVVLGKIFEFVTGAVTAVAQVALVRIVLFVDVILRPLELRVLRWIDAYVPRVILVDERLFLLRRGRRAGADFFCVVFFIL